MQHFALPMRSRTALRRCLAKQITLILLNAYRFVCSYGKCSSRKLLQPHVKPALGLLDFVFWRPTWRSTCWRSVGSASMIAVWQ